MEKTVKELRAEKLNVHGIPCHVGKDSDRKNLVKETLSKFGGRIDAFVSNAAVNPTYGPVLKTTEEQWDKLFEINVKAAFLLYVLNLPKPLHPKPCPLTVNKTNLS